MPQGVGCRVGAISGRTDGIRQDTWHEMNRSCTA